jgi:hypothetical protein
LFNDDAEQHRAAGSHVQCSTPDHLSQFSSFTCSAPFNVSCSFELSFVSILPSNQNRSLHEQCFLPFSENFHRSLHIAAPFPFSSETHHTRNHQIRIPEAEGSLSLSLSLSLCVEGIAGVYVYSNMPNLLSCLVGTPVE